MLYPDIVPQTADNFMELVRNYARQQYADAFGTNQKFPHYVGTSFYKYIIFIYAIFINFKCIRIFVKTHAVGGDNTRNNGHGGRSAYGKDFPSENFLLDPRFPGTYI